MSQKHRQDSEFSDIFRFLEDGVLPEDRLQAKRMVLERQRYAIVDGVLQYENPDFPGVWRIAVPQCTRRTLLEEAHNRNFAGHFAERKVYANLRKKYWWNRMKADVCIVGRVWCTLPGRALDDERDRLCNLYPLVSHSTEWASMCSSCH